MSMIMAIIYIRSELLKYTDVLDSQNIITPRS